MKSETVRRLHELGELAQCDVLFRYSGVVILHSVERDEREDIGWIHVGTGLCYVPATTKDAEGWETTSRKEGQSLRAPFFSPRGGDRYLTVRQAFDRAGQPPDYVDLLEFDTPIPSDHQ
jgi:hypothetical protein